MTEVWAVSMVKDEADVIAGTIRHLADEGVDGFVIADNDSHDGTWKILVELQHEMTERGISFVIVKDPEVGYYQSIKMTRLAQRASELANTPDLWIIPFDADEIWYCLGPQRLGDLLRGLRSLHQAKATLWNHVATSLDSDDPDPFVAMRWRMREPGALPKVAFRWRRGATVEMGNHGVTFEESTDPIRLSALTDMVHIRHFSWRSGEQLTRKAINGAAAYAASDLPEEYGAHWRAWGRLIEANGAEVMSEVFHAHYWHLSPTDAGLVEDPAPYMRWR